jgi:hypothetical protein
MMAGIDERVEESKNWWERFAEKIPGIRGYKKKEIRRETDKIQRVYVAERLDTCLGKLDDVKLDLVKAGNLDALGEIDVVMRKLRTAADRVRFADYGYAGMFDPVKVGAEKIDELYAFVKSLETDAGSIVELSAALAAASPSLRTDIGLLADRIEALDARFSEREQLITGAGR